MPTTIRDANPLSTNDSQKNENTDHNTSTHFPSILLHPKQKLTAQFKRAITLMKQRSEPTHEVETSISLVEKSNCSLDPILLTSLVEEPPIHNEPAQPIGTVITLETNIRSIESNQTLSTKLIKQTAVTPGTLSPTPTTTAGEFTVLVTNL